MTEEIEVICPMCSLKGRAKLLMTQKDGTQHWNCSCHGEWEVPGCVWKKMANDSNSTTGQDLEKCKGCDGRDIKCNIRRDLIKKQG